MHIFRRTIVVQLKFLLAMLYSILISVTIEKILIFWFIHERVYKTAQPLNLSLIPVIFHTSTIYLHFVSSHIHVFFYNNTCLDHLSWLCLIIFKNFNINNFVFSCVASIWARTTSSKITTRRVFMGKRSSSSQRGTLSFKIFQERASILAK